MAIGSVVFPCCHKVLPLTYDQSLSYYEQLCKLVNKVNEVIDTFNDYEEIINRLAELVVDIESILRDVNELKVEMTNANADINGLKNSVVDLSQEDARLQEEINRLTAKINNIVLQYDGIIAYVDNAVASVKIENQADWIKFEQHINVLIGEMRAEIDDLRKLVSEVPTSVYNPVRGYREGFNKNNADVYHDLRYGGFTNAELSEFGISNNHVASLVHNNRDYALHAKKRFKRHYVFCPVNGLEFSHANALSQVLDKAIGVMDNTSFYGYMTTNELTNDDLDTLIETNINRVTVNLA